MRKIVKTMILIIVCVMISGINTKGNVNEAGIHTQEITDQELLQIVKSALSLENDWQFRQCIKLDYNQDGLPDIIGILYNAGGEEDTEILFGLTKQENGEFILDFQDKNPININPYSCLLQSDETDDTSFSIISHGRRSVETTSYNYENGKWYVMYTEYQDSKAGKYSVFLTNDYKAGIGKREYSDAFGEEVFNANTGLSEVTFHTYNFEVKLEDPPTLEEYNFNIYNQTQWMEAIPDKPQRAIKYNNAQYVLYTYRDEADTTEYFALYNKSKQLTSVLDSQVTSTARGLGGYYDEVVIYKDKIYYTEKRTKKFKVFSGDRIYNSNEYISVKLNSMELDGSNKNTIYEIKNDYSENEDLEARLPYLWLEYEITGDQIFINVYDEYYVSNLNGSEITKLEYSITKSTIGG